MTICVLVPLHLKSLPALIAPVVVLATLTFFVTVEAPQIDQVLNAQIMP